MKQDQYKKIWKSLDEEFELMKTAERKIDIKLVIKGNSLKHKIEEKLKEIEIVSNAIEENRLKLV